MYHTIRVIANRLQYSKANQPALKDLNHKVHNCYQTTLCMYMYCNG